MENSTGATIHNKAEINNKEKATTITGRGPECVETIALIDAIRIPPPN